MLQLILSLQHPSSYPPSLHPFAEAHNEDVPRKRQRNVSVETGRAWRPHLLAVSEGMGPNIGLLEARAGRRQSVRAAAYPPRGAAGNCQAIARARATVPIGLFLMGRRSAIG